MRYAAHDTAPGHEQNWLGVSAAEVEHLVAQAEVYAAEADALLDSLDVVEGMSAVDVGCGICGVLHLLCDRVGPAGRVVGLDAEPRLLALAAELTAKRGMTIETVHADATDTGLPSASFDLVHERTLLFDLARPQDAVAEMTRLARSGGTVALQEADSAGWVCDPPHPAFDRLQVELLAAYPRAGKDFDTGRRAARMLRDAGLRHVEVRACARVTGPGDYFQAFLPTLCMLLRDQLLDGHALTPDQLDTYVGQLREHLARPGTLTCPPMLWQAWGVKP